MIASILLAAGLIVTLLLIPVIWAFAPRIMSRLDTPSSSTGDATDLDKWLAHARTERVRASFLPLLTSITIVAGVFITLYQFHRTQESGARHDRELRDQFSLTLESQGQRDITTLFVESLKLIYSGESDATQRTGAIYALQTVMEHDPNFHNAVLTTLVTLIRERRSRIEHPDCRLVAVSSAPDVQAAIDVIGHRSDKWADTELVEVLNFQRLCLLGADFRSMLLNHANFEQSDLRRTNFDDAWVESANFSAADMDYQTVGTEADERTTDGFRRITNTYRMAQLITMFRRAHAAGALFEGSCVRGVDFTRTDLTPRLDDGKRDDNFNDAGVSLANFAAVTGLSFKGSLHGACARQPPSNLPETTDDLKCEVDMRGIQNPARLPDPHTADRCDRDVFQLGLPATKFKDQS